MTARRRPETMKKEEAHELHELTRICFFFFISFLCFFCVFLCLFVANPLFVFFCGYFHGRGGIRQNRCQFPVFPFFVSFWAEITRAGLYVPFSLGKWG
jgi:hypothetical protein